MKIDVDAVFPQAVEDARKRGMIVRHSNSSKQVAIGHISQPGKAFQHTSRKAFVSDYLAREANNHDG